MAETNAPAPLVGETSAAFESRQREEFRVRVERALAVLEQQTEEHDAALKRGAARFGEIGHEQDELRKFVHDQFGAHRDKWQVQLDAQTAEIKKELDVVKQAIQPRRWGIGALIAVGALLLTIAGVIWRAGQYPTRDELNLVRESGAQRDTRITRLEARFDDFDKKLDRIEHALTTKAVP
jgi:hypothetical protein